MSRLVSVRTPQGSVERFGFGALKVARVLSCEANADELAVPPETVNRLAGRKMIWKERKMTRRMLFLVSEEKSEQSATSYCKIYKCPGNCPDRPPRFISLLIRVLTLHYMPIYFCHFAWHLWRPPNGRLMASANRTACH